MNEKIKYDPEYISYVNTGKSAAVFITRDIVTSINTKGKWIDVLETKGDKNNHNQWDFKEIIVEIFPRTIQPEYPSKASEEEFKYITWSTATEDIAAQRERGVEGIKWKIVPKLINVNKGKYHAVERVWNRTFEQYVPRKWGVNSSCEIRKCRVPVEPKWEYYILGVKRL